MLAELSKVDSVSHWADEEAFWNSDHGFESQGDRGFDACETCLGYECKVDLRTVRPKVFSEKLISDGYSIYSCRSCNASFSNVQVQKFRVDFMNMVCSCGDKMNLVDSAVSVLPESAHMLDIDEVKSSVWYHATESDNWLDAVKQLELIPYVHIGTRKAAMDRAKQISKRSLRRTGKNSKIWLWQVTVDSNASIASSILDDEDDWLTAVTECSVKGLGGNAIRYVNRYESTGSVSLLIDPTFISSDSVEEIPAESLAA